MEFKTLANGINIPMIGLGVYQLADTREKTAEIIFDAICMGYRMIDTASSYLNEDAVGTAVRKAVSEGVCKREDLFISSKIQVTRMRNFNAAQKAIELSLSASGLDYFDMYLLHQAMGDYFSSWKALEKAYEQGRFLAIGVSNFFPGILANFCETVDIKPMINQIEIHPYFQREPDLKECNRYHVQPVAWGPLGHGETANNKDRMAYPIMNDPLIQTIAEKYFKTPAQVILRWNVQRGVVVIPKSTNKGRLKENLDLWDFTLSEEDMAAISTLDKGYSGIRVIQFDPDFVRARFGRQEPDFTIRYHRTEEEPPAEMVTEVTYGSLQQTLKVEQLRFSNPGLQFAGWKVFREYDGKFFARHSSGLKEWVRAVDGSLPPGYQYILYKNGEGVMKTAPSGTVHFYAQWK